MIKKITVFLLAAAIIFNMPASFASMNDASPEINAVKLFEALGVIDNADEYLGNLNREMTRGEIAALLGGLLKDGGFSGDVQIFDDVPPTHKAFREINILAQQGIVSGTGNGLFEPDRVISYPEALALVLKMTGYGELIGENGGFPNGCYSVVRNYRLFESPDLTAEPTVGNIFELIYRAAREDLFQVAEVQYDYTLKRPNENRTILSSFFDVYLTEGILTSDGVVDINSTALPPRNEIMVDGVRYLSDKNYSDLLGQYVICFYRESDSVSKTAVYVAPGRVNEVLDVEAENVESFENMTFKYYKSKSRTAKIDIKSSMDIIYNNTVVTELTDDMMQPEEGFIRFIDNDGDGKYNVVIIKSYESFVVRSISEIDGETVLAARDALNLPTVSVMTDGDSDTVIYDSNNEPKTYEDIKTGITVSVAGISEGGKKKAKEIILSDATVYGDVVGYEDSTDEASLMIDGVPYKITSSLRPLLEKIGIRNAASFNLDVFGNIVDVIETDMSKLDLAMGYLVNADYDKHSKKLYLKIFTELGKFVIYDAGDKAKVDGVLYKEAKNIYNALLPAGDAEVKPQLISYKLSGNREVNYIDRPEAYNGTISSDYYNRLAITVPMTSFYYQREQQSFGGKVVMDENTKVFVIPEDVKTAKNSDYQVIKPSDVVGSATHSVEAYSLNNDRVPSDAVILKATSSNMPTTSIAMAVTNISSAVNEAGETTYLVTLIGTNGIEKYMTVDTEVIDNAPAQNVSDNSEYKIEVGDIVRIDKNKSDEITKMLLIYDYSKEEIMNGMTFSGSYFSAARAVVANVYRILGDYMQITNKDLSALGEGAVLAISDLENQKLSKFKVVKYENVNGKLKFLMGNEKDLVPYTTSSSDYSRIVIYTHSANERILFVLDR